MRLQFRLALTCTALAALSVGACLVTDKVEYGEPNFPPLVVKVQPSDSTLSVRVPSSPQCGEDTDPSRTSGLWMTFAVLVSDPNIDDGLTYRLLVNGRQAGGGSIPRTDRAERGEFRVCATRDNLSAACNRVDFLVSRQFDEGKLPYGTVEENDLGKVSWLVLGNAIEYPEIYQSDCDAVDGGVR